MRHSVLLSLVLYALHYGAMLFDYFKSGGINIDLV